MCRKVLAFPITGLQNTERAKSLTFELAGSCGFDIKVLSEHTERKEGKGWKVQFIPL
jgi:hypothetical protein